MKKINGLFLAMAIATSSYGVTSGATMQNNSSDNVLVELFTSEGCSSCPPADRLLSQLAKSSTANSKIIVLSEHVDYWNYLGWSDPFSAPQFTERQRAYGSKFKDRSQYTPQMVVDGKYAFVGSDSSQAERSINEEMSAKKRVLGLTATFNAAQKKVETTVTVPGDKVSTSPNNKISVSIALVEDDVVSNVKRGENEGRSLRHDGIVRSLKKLAQIAGDNKEPLQIKGAIVVDPSWQIKNLRVVAFLQDGRDLEILRAQQVNLSIP